MKLCDSIFILGSIESRDTSDESRKCERGGIGRRARFRSLCPSGRGGSNPLARSFWL